MLNNKNIKRLSIFFPLSILVITGIAYGLVFRGFFQHDEWVMFGRYFLGKENVISAFVPAVSHYVPLTRFFLYLYFLVFQLNFSWYACLSILGHLAVVFLAFIFFSELLRSRVLGFLAGLLFAIGASGHQATSWVGTDIATHSSVIFGLLSLIFILNFQKIWPSVICLIISLLFKEATIAFFVLLPLTIYLFDRKNYLKSQLNYLKIPLVGFFYFLFRLSMVFFPRFYIKEQLVSETQSFSDIFVNLITFPAKIYAQALIPIGLLLNLARQFTKILPVQITGLYGTTAFDNFLENITLQVINWVIFILSFILLAYVVRKTKDRTIKNTAIFGFIFAIVNSFIYVLSPGRPGSIPVVDSRNVYLPSLGIAVFLISAVYILAKGKIVKIILIIFPLVFLNIFWLEKELKILADRGTERKAILYQIKHSYSTLPKKVVFYMTSDTSFYGFPESEKIFPFEVNLGYTLIVWYQLQEHFPPEFFDKTIFLDKLTDEGYKEIGGRGFGYFRNWGTLIHAIRDNQLEKDSIIAFAYNSRTKSVEDITSKIRAKIN